MVEHNSQLEVIRQRISAHRADELTKLSAHKETELRHAEQQISRARLQREQAVADATFREIFYTSNNIIFGFERGGQPEPIFANGTQMLSREERALAESLRRKRQSHIDAREVEQFRLHSRLLERDQLENAIKRHEKRVSRFGQSIKTMARSRTESNLADGKRRELQKLDLNIESTRASIALHEQEVDDFSKRSVTRPAIDAAVADLALDTQRNRLYFGRWASPFQVGVCELGDGTDQGRGDREPKALYQRPQPVSSLVVAEFEGQPYLLWIEGNSEIWVVRTHDGEPDESDPRKLHDISAPGRGGFFQLAYDEVTGFLFWSNTLSIWRARLSDDMSKSAAMVISPSESPNPIDIAVDGANDALYWIDRERGWLSRSTLDGNQKEDLFRIERPVPGLEVDTHAGFVYWADERDGATFLRRGSTGQTALVFDGKSNYLEIPDDDRTRSYTIEIKFDATTPESGRSVLFGRYENDHTPTLELTVEADGVWLRNTERELLVAPAAGPQMLSVSVSEGSRYCDVLVVNNERERFDVRMQIAASGLGSWFIGAAKTGQGFHDFYTGAVREVRIWSQARTVREIETDRDRPIDAGLEDDLYGLWRSAERVGPLLPDLTNNNQGIRLMSLGAEQSQYSNVAAFRVPFQRMELPGVALDAASGFSVEMWVYLESGAPTTLWSMHDDERDTHVSLGTDGDTFRLRFKVKVPGGNTTLISGSLAVHEWVHVAATFDPGAKARLYVNGETTQREGRTMPSNWLLSADTLAVGGQQEHGLAFLGLMSELRVWSGAVPGLTLRRRRHIRVSPGAPGLLGYWPMAEGRGDTTKTSAGPVAPGVLLAVEPHILEAFRKIDQAVAETRARLTELERDDAKLGANSANVIRATIATEEITQQANERRESAEALASTDPRRAEAFAAVDEVMLLGSIMNVDVEPVIAREVDLLAELESAVLSEAVSEEAAEEAAAAKEAAEEAAAAKEAAEDAENKDAAIGAPVGALVPVHIVVDVVDVVEVSRSQLRAETERHLEMMLSERQAMRRTFHQADMWNSALLPIATPEVHERRVHEVLEVGGCSGLVIHFKADYGAGLRAQAAAKITTVTEAVNNDRQRAQGAAAQRLALTEQARSDAVAKHQRTVAAARSRAKTNIELARGRQSANDRVVTKNRARTLRSAAERVGDAQDQATGSTSAARSASGQIVSQARVKRDNGERKHDDAINARSKF